MHASAAPEEEPEEGNIRLVVVEEQKQEQMLK
jgi:hypothetical protein